MIETPMCWKCTHSIMVEQLDHSGYTFFKMVGCNHEGCEDIKSYNDAELRCPLIGQCKTIK